MYHYKILCNIKKDKLVIKNICIIYNRGLIFLIYKGFLRFNKKNNWKVSKGYKYVVYRNIIDM